MKTLKKIFVAGHNGMVGAAICRNIAKRSRYQLITSSRSELDLCNQSETFKFFESERPDEVIIAAAKVGGIHANNQYPANFIYENLQIQNNLIHAAHVNGVQKLLFLGSSCIYPKYSKQPISEDELLTASLEPTNEPYAVAKIAGLKMCESYNRQYGRDYRCVMPTNLYGPGDNYHSQNSHVIPALIRRFHEAKLNNDSELFVWGTGKPKREFMFVDDVASACIFIHNLNKQIFYDRESSKNTHVNIGVGQDIEINELANLIKKIVGFKGKVLFDPAKPDGSPRKLMNVDLMEKWGWKPSVHLKDGLKLAYEDFKDRH